KSDGFLLYRLSTLHTSVFDGNYSGFTAPNTLTGNWRNVDNKPPLHNDKLVFEPTTQWGAYYDKKDSIYQYPDIKYVKFFVHYDPIYSNLVTGSLSLKDLTVSVYDVT